MKGYVLISHPLVCNETVAIVKISYSEGPSQRSSTR
jgi:hypothetical protein